MMMILWLFLHYYASKCAPMNAISLRSPHNTGHYWRSCTSMLCPFEGLCHLCLFDRCAEHQDRDIVLENTISVPPLTPFPRQSVPITHWAHGYSRFSVGLSPRRIPRASTAGLVIEARLEILWMYSKNRTAPPRTSPQSSSSSNWEVLY